MFCWGARTVMSSPNHSSEEISALHAWDECLPAAKEKKRELCSFIHSVLINSAKIPNAFFFYKCLKIPNSYVSAVTE